MTLSVDNSVPSDQAIEAAAIATASLNRAGVGNPGPSFFSTPYARAALVAAHDPALGLDRSVCLRSLVEAFRDAQRGWIDPGMSDSAKARAMERMGDLAAAFIEREFGGKD